MAGPVSNYSDEIAAAMAEAYKQSQLNPQPDPSTGLPYASDPQAWTEGDDMARIGRFLRPSTMVDDRRNEPMLDSVSHHLHDLPGNLGIGWERFKNGIDIIVNGNKPNRDR
jgi:hypothetical protein